MYYTRVLSNGVTVVAENMASVRSVAFGIWVRGGSRAESVGGASHFLEHMMFRGTHRRSGAQIAQEMDAIGGHVNAFTSKEHTCYYTLTLDEHLDTAMDVLADMFFSSKLAEEDIAKEKDIIFEEIDMVEDTPDDLIFDVMQESVWGDSALAPPILGTKESVNSITQDVLRSALCCSPSDVVVAVAGNFGGMEELISKIDALFGREWATPAPRNSSKPTIYTPKIIARHKPIEQLHMLLGFPGVEVGSEQRYDMAVLNTILGAGMSSVLFQRIREEMGLAYAVYSHNSSFSDTGILYIYAAVSTQNAKAALSAILEETTSLPDLSQDTLRHAQAQIKSSLLLNLESTQSRMVRIGRGHITLGEVAGLDEISEGIEAVSLDSLRRLMSETLKPSAMSLSAVGPIEAKDMAGLKDLVGGYGLSA